MKPLIRQETPEDAAAVRRVVKSAFEHAAHTDHDEHNLVERLRRSTSYLPELSLVAQQEGQIVGHILFTKITIGTQEAIALAPLAVAPALQGQGIGAALIREGHRIAKEQGFLCSVVLGHPGYYPRFGYVPSAPFGIRTPFDVPDENFMVCFLQGQTQRIDGTVAYDPAFFTQ